MTEIKYKDVRKGDLVSVVTEVKGVKITRTGRADYRVIGYKDWKTADNGHLNMDASDVTITLLDRPVPPLPTVRGTIIRAKKVRGVEGEFTLYLNHSGRWMSFFGITVTKFGTTYYTHAELDIEDWEEMELVKK